MPGQRLGSSGQCHPTAVGRLNAVSARRQHPEPGTAFPYPFPLSTLLGRVQSLFTAEFDRRLAEAGFEDLSLALGNNVLRHLSPDGLRVGVLAERAGVSKQAISQQLTYLEQHGYVQLEADQADSRAKRARLTSLGADSQQVARQIFADLERDWRHRFGEEQLRTLRSCLEAILIAHRNTGITPDSREDGNVAS